MSVQGAKGVATVRLGTKERESILHERKKGKAMEGERYFLRRVVPILNTIRIDRIQSVVEMKRHH
ncbi:hypothetical protein CER18_08390 [Bartonella tribocorum]|uniref:Uncharacterized protein n=1 Tax=Bartonella tribocorum TaxID=85701 RepID=A0A2N9Y8S5_9HYPH|nr:hypothetical protein CER18_08390 [Bartonella tribocorum]